MYQFLIEKELLDILEKQQYVNMHIFSNTHTHTHTHTHLGYSTAQQSKVSSEKQRGLCQQSTIHCPEPNLVLCAGYNVSLNNGRKDM